MKQLALAIETRPEPRFQGFVAGANALALEQLQVMARDAAQPETAPAVAAPWYLWGPSGTGKTHLLQALAGCLRARGAAVAWFCASDPTPWRLAADDANTACPTGVSASPPTLIVLDGCDDFDAAQQQAAFLLFVAAAGQAHCLIAAAGRLPPVDLAIREDLRTRLGWGHVLALAPLGEADTRLALHAAASARGLALADDVTDYLLTHFARDLKHLMVQIDRLDHFALEARRPISLAMLRQMLAEEAVST